MMKLTEAQKTSPLWHALRAHYVARLTQLRTDNDNPALDEIATAALRARIDECKKFVDMDSTEPEITVSGM